MLPNWGVILLPYAVQEDIWKNLEMILVVFQLGGGRGLLLVGRW